MPTLDTLRANPHPSVLRTPSSVTREKVSLPHNFTPRIYQTEDLFRPLFPHHYPDLRVLGTPRKKRIVLLWHRRAGKDLSSISALAIAAYEEIGNYLYLLPEQTQAKKIIWRGIDDDGHRFIDRVPESIIKKKYESEMLLELVNGSTIQIGGSDNYNSWMGTNPKGIIFSEYSLQDPMAWQYFRPILLQNGGWAVFIYTARGRNHGFDLAQMAKRNESDFWHFSKKTIDHTFRHDGKPVISREQYDQEIEDGMPQNLAEQEFYLSFDAALVGAVYGDQMAKIQEKGWIDHFPYDPNKKVHTAWDLGNDGTPVIFAQQDEGGNPKIIDHFEFQNTPFSEVCREVLRKPYIFGHHFAPHDVVNRDPETGSRVETARNLGVNFFVTPRGSVDDGIEATRGLLSRTRFHQETTERLVDALTSYHYPWDDKLRRYKDKPVHDWSCLPKGTQIQTPDGSCAVEDFRPGDCVKIAGIKARVTRAHRVGVKNMIGLSLPNRVIIRCSEDHKIFTTNGLKKAKDIVAGDELITEKGVREWSVDKKGIRRAFIESFKESDTDYGKTGIYTSARRVESNGCYTASCGGPATGASLTNTLSCRLTEIGMISESKTGYADLMHSTEGSTKQNTTGKFLTGLRTEGSRSQGISQQKTTERQHICTERYGWHTMERFQRGVSFITSTAIKAITWLRIFNFLRCQNTALFMRKQTLGVEVKPIKNISEQRVKSLPVLSVKRLPEEMTYDIEVEHHHAYVLKASGIVTSNSHSCDAMRILAMNWNDQMLDDTWFNRPLNLNTAWIR